MECFVADSAWLEEPWQSLTSRNLPASSFEIAKEENIYKVEAGKAQENSPEISRVMIIAKWGLA